MEDLNFENSYAAGVVVVTEASCDSLWLHI